jgi:hypothetical protein
MTNERGVYTLSSNNGNPGKGAVEGEYIVTIAKIEVIDKNVEGQPYRASLEIAKDHLPPVYRNRAKTPLKATVNKGRNQIDFDLESSAK